MPREAPWLGDWGESLVTSFPTFCHREGQQGFWLPSQTVCLLPVYAAGKAATSGVPSIYAPSTYAYLSPAKTPPPAAMIPMGPVYNGYSGDFDRNSSGEAYGSLAQR